MSPQKIHTMSGTLGRQAGMRAGGQAGRRASGQAGRWAGGKVDGWIDRLVGYLTGRLI